MRWAVLFLAIGCEVVGTLSLRASGGLQRRRWVPAIAVSYLIAFGALALALRDGMPLSIAYGIWAASGIALTAVAARIIFKDPLTRTMGLGILLAAAGVFLIELGAVH